ncbi:hypothetical protein Cadr_000012874 [Camelus dromedarius]|uniref:Secreted protein n=1 Tax=Camelus dromedarius TaxID=9838 RepID=A0A5N4DA10_CAMDR|nr:hypothetical protein Cadr_000012874 [Camelus dromedarius]
MHFLLILHVHIWVSTDCVPVVFIRIQVDGSASVWERGDGANYRLGPRAFAWGGTSLQLFIDQTKFMGQT